MAGGKNRELGFLAIDRTGRCPRHAAAEPPTRPAAGTDSHGRMDQPNARLTAHRQCALDDDPAAP
jgi:hypothetical protein